MNLLLTGGTGYIGSHTAVVMTEAGHNVVLYDNLSNSNLGVVTRIEKITGKSVSFVQGDIRDTKLLIETLSKFKVDAVIHFAGLKAVGESVEKPIKYFDNNVGGTISLIKAMQVSQIKTLVFSSSATVYGNPQYLPIDEDHPTSAINPYGNSKLHIEKMLADLAKSDDSWRIASLRYFNPIGAHATGLIGENPRGIPNNLMPYITGVALGILPCLNIYGNDYDTVDGTGIRDYIHVVDLAEGHLAALNYLFAGSLSFSTFNLGTGKGVSVFQILNIFEKVTGKQVPYQIVGRREGDVASCYAKVKKSTDFLGWFAKRNLEDMCFSYWMYSSKNIRL